MFFSVLSKNLNWEILTKNLVTIKRWDEVKDEKFQYYGRSLEKPIFMGFHEKPMYRGELPRKGAWTVWRFKGGGRRAGGGSAKKRGWGL